jgi:hypothetical protein
MLWREARACKLTELTGTCALGKLTLVAHFEILLRLACGGFWGGQAAG